MRLSTLFIAIVLLVPVSNGCRSTRDASDAELVTMNLLSDSFWDSQNAQADQGEASVGTLSSNYTLLMALSTPASADLDTDGMAIAAAPNGSPTPGYFMDAARGAWPECIQEVENGVSYAECEYSLTGEEGSISFLLDGGYHWYDQATDADLTFDLSVGSNDLSWEWMSHWGMDFEWTDTTLDGSFAVDYSYGASLGGSPPLGGAVFSLTGDVSELTIDESCDLGPVSGSIDWSSIHREGLSRPETEHVTIEWLECGTATITM